MKKLIFCSVFSVSLPASAQTLWCDVFKLGCPSADRNTLIVENCKMLSNESYKEALSQALADPSVWRLSGHTSAQDYASWRKDFMFQTCLRRQSR